MTRHDSTTRTGRRYICPRCERRLKEVNVASGTTAYVCSNPDCSTVIAALSIEDVVLRPVICPGYVCSKCAHPVVAQLMADERVICICPCCRHRSRQFEEHLEHLDACKRVEVRQCRAEMAHVPFERMTPERRVLTDNPDRVAAQMIGRNRRARHKHERLARPARDREGNYYCIRHQVKLRRCPVASTARYASVPVPLSRR